MAVGPASQLEQPWRLSKSEDAIQTERNQPPAFVLNDEFFARQTETAIPRLSLQVIALRQGGWAKGIGFSCLQLQGGWLHPHTGVPAPACAGMPLRSP